MQSRTTTSSVAYAVVMSHIVDAPKTEAEPEDDADQRRLGERLQRLRTERKWSLTELAEESGVSRAMINRVERGVSSPTATILGRLSGAFGLTISQLLDEALEHDVPRSTDPDEARGVQRGATADSGPTPRPGTAAVRSRVPPSTRT